MMIITKNNEFLHGLRALLEQEARAVHSMDHDGLAEIQARKLDYIHSLKHGEIVLPRVELEKLSLALSQQAEMLSAVQSGLRSAMEKIKAIRDAATTMRVYAAGGEFNTIRNGDIEQKL